MKRFYILLILVAVLAAGVFVGFRYASHRYGQAVSDTICSYEFLHASEVLTRLRDLRAGNTNAAFEALEGQLDTSVISLRGILDDCPTIDHARNYTNLLLRIGEYRAIFPYRVDAAVTQILANAKEGK